MNMDLQKEALRLIGLSVAGNFTLSEARDFIVATGKLLSSVLAEPQPAQLVGWTFKRNKDGSIGIHSPPPQPGESQRTSDVICPIGSRDLHELLGKLVDHLAQQPQPPIAWMAEKANAVRFTNIGASADELERLGWTITPLSAHGIGKP